MATESELREAIAASANTATTGIDAAAVVRRARARRRPRQVAFSSLSVLAAAGVVVLGVTTLPSMLPSQNGAADSSVMSTAPESMLGEAGGDTETQHFGARELTPRLCGAPTAPTGPNPAGLMLSVDFPDSSPTGAHTVAGTVSVTNTGASRVSGTTVLQPAIAVSRDGMTVWHSDGVPASGSARIDLDPGESHPYDASFTAVTCTPHEGTGERSPSNRAPLMAGPYEVRAEIVFVPDGARPGENILVGGPPGSIELR